MKKELKEIFDKLKDNKDHHLCCISDANSISVSLNCTGEDLFYFLATICQNTDWAFEVIETFVESQYNDDDDETEDITPNTQYLN